MSKTVDSYELRYGWSLPHLRLCAIAAMFVAVTFIPGFPLLLAIAVWLFFGGGLVVLMHAALRRAVLVRVDASGVFLGAGLLARPVTGRLVPWSDVAAVVLWEWQLHGRHRLLGFISPDGPRDLLPRTSDGLRQVNRSLAGPMANCSVGLGASRFDINRLASTLDRVAPHVALHDATTVPVSVIREGRRDPL